MTIKQIKLAIFFCNATLTYCKHRKIKGYWEYFLIYGGDGFTVKIKGNRFKSVNNWLHTRVKNRNK